jgi:hypothetical protein
MACARWRRSSSTPSGGATVTAHGRQICGASACRGRAPGSSAPSGSRRAPRRASPRPSLDPARTERLDHQACALEGHRVESVGGDHQGGPRPVMPSASCAKLPSVGKPSAFTPPHASSRASPSPSHKRKWQIQQTPPTKSACHNERAPINTMAHYDCSQRDVSRVRTRLGERRARRRRWPRSRVSRSRRSAGMRR